MEDLQCKVEENTFCGLCNEWGSDYETVNHATREMCNTLSLETDLFRSNETVICNKCVANVKECSDFKLVCLNTENYIRSFTNNDKVDLKEVYLLKNTNRNGNSIPRGHTVCRLCMDLVKRDASIGNGDVLLKTILDLYFSELDLNITQEPSVCASCYSGLRNYYDFMQRCSGVATNQDDNEYRIDNKEDVQLEIKDVVKRENYIDSCAAGACQGEYADVTGIKTGLEASDLKHENDFDRIEERTDDHSSKNAVYSCDSCRYKTTSKYNITQHLLTYRKRLKDSTFHTCEFKPKYDTTPGDANENKPKVVAYECEICALKEKERAAMHRCDLCEYKTKKKNHLKVHRLTHKASSELTLYRCEFCKFKTKRIHDLKKHLMTHQGPSETTFFYCAKCDYKTKYKFNLLKHLRRH